jgi:cell wall-associated NlpC family hydrolase
MVKSGILILLFLFTFSAQAEMQRREPSLFLEYERELKRSNETLKGEVSFQKLMAPISVAKSAEPTPPLAKTITSVDSIPPKLILTDKEIIGKDSAPFLVVNNLAPANLNAVCPDKQPDPVQNNSKSIIKNIQFAKEKVLAKAKVFLGTPYGFGDKNNTHTDCSGFTQQVYQQFGISLPHSAEEQAQYGERVNPDDLQVGDLLFYRTYKHEPSHVAIYAGDGQIIHASYTARKVQFDSIDKGYYKQRFLYAKRLAFNNSDHDE